MSDPISKLGLTCPSGGDFYICQGNSTQFLGCCTSNPCEDGKGKCPQSDLRTSSFNDSTYGDIKSQACASTGEWYTCSQLDTPFLGCCSTDACDSGCPTKDLLAAKLSDNTKSAAIFETTTAIAAATTTTTASSTGVKSTTTASSSTTRASSAAATEMAGTHSASATGLSTGAKAGIAVGTAVVILALLAALFIFGRRYLRKRRGVVVTGSPPSVLMSNPTNSYLYHDPNRILHTPPPISSPSLEPLAASHAGRSPAGSDAIPPHRSANSSPSWGGDAPAASRHASANYAVAEGLDTAGLHSASSPQQQQQGQNQSQRQPVAELDGGNGPETPGSFMSELPYSPPWSARLQSHPPSMYTPYRPSMQEFGDMKSGLYP